MNYVMNYWIKCLKNTKRNMKKGTDLWFLYPKATHCGKLERTYSLEHEAIELINVIVGRQKIGEGHYL